MRKADFQARIKKIEIVNRVPADGWSQSIRVNLDEIELTNENLLELRQFRPNEPVNVIIKPAEPNLFDVAGSRTQGVEQPKPANGRAPTLDDPEDFLTITEDDEDVPPPGKVIKEFKV